MGDPMFHGTAVNSEWRIDVREAEATMAIDLAAPLPLSHVSREVRLLDDAAGYETTLCLTARTDCDLPLSLHPCLTMPDTPGDLILDIAQSGPGWTYPVSPVPARPGVAADTRFESLATVPAPEGGTVDLTRLPPETPCEILVQLPVATGRAALLYPRMGVRVTFEWDAALLPCLVLWISNRGRDEAPFDGRFRTLGVEAVAGAFDLGPHISRNSENPVAREGLATTVSLRAGHTLRTDSRITIEPL